MKKKVLNEFVEQLLKYRISNDNIVVRINSHYEVITNSVDYELVIYTYKHYLVTVDVTEDEIYYVLKAIHNIATIFSCTTTIK